MGDLQQLVALAGVLGSGCIGGVFFAFSSFIMPALRRPPAQQGLTAMQSINLTVLCPSFLGVFLGTAVVSLGAVVLAGSRWDQPGAAAVAAGGALYLVGCFLGTIARNVPLNDTLERVRPTGPQAAEAWEGYQREWTRWNHVRTVAALLATLSFSLGL